MIDSLTKAYPLKSERYMQYRDQLLKAGFTEAELKPGHFFLQTTKKTAFIINLDDENKGVSVMYGFASTAFMAGEEGYFNRNGTDNDICQVRNILFLHDDEDEVRAAETISEFYTLYKDYPKDDILVLKKERQKAFLNQFARALKPLGFKRKDTKWTKDLCNGTALSFYAQKSDFSDQYYFNVIVHNVADYYDRLSWRRVVMYDSEIYNWQLMTEKQIEDLIQYTLENYIIPKLSS